MSAEIEVHAEKDSGNVLLLPGATGVWKYCIFLLFPLSHQSMKITTFCRISGESDCCASFSIRNSITCILFDSIRMAFQSSYVSTVPNSYIDT